MNIVAFWGLEELYKVLEYDLSKKALFCDVEPSYTVKGQPLIVAFYPYIR
jgi:hypothetical protein